MAPLAHHPPHVLPARRVALVSCCRALWARQDLAGSAALWGQLSLGRRVLPAELTAARAGSLAAWLGRRRPALRSVALDGVGDCAAAAAVLGSLARSPLQHLRLLHTKAAGAGLGSALAALPSLTRLELVSCIGALPAELAGLSAGLVVLSVSGNPALGRGEAHGALAPLQHLTALTRLDASGCDLKYVPPQLSRLQRLQDLDLSSNDLRALTEAGAGWAFEPLERLTALTRLVGGPRAAALGGPGCGAHLGRHLGRDLGAGSRRHVSRRCSHTPPRSAARNACDHPAPAHAAHPGRSCPAGPECVLHQLRAPAAVGPQPPVRPRFEFQLWQCCRGGWRWHRELPRPGVPHGPHAPGPRALPPAAAAAAAGGAGGAGRPGPAGGRVGALGSMWVGGWTGGWEREWERKSLGGGAQTGGWERGSLVGCQLRN